MSRYQYSPIPPRATKSYYPPTDADIIDGAVLPVSPRQAGQNRRAGNGCVPVFITGMTIIAAIVMIWNLYVIPAVDNYQTQYHYGDSRVSLTYLNVGHDGLSEFVAFENVQNEIVVIEIDGTKYTAYTGPTLLNTSRQVVTVAIDPSSNPSKPNLVVRVLGEDGGLELYNTGDKFSWSK